MRTIKEYKKQLEEENKRLDELLREKKITKRPSQEWDINHDLIRACKQRRAHCEKRIHEIQRSA